MYVRAVMRRWMRVEVVVEVIVDKDWVLGSTFWTNSPQLTSADDIVAANESRRISMRKN